MSGYLRRAALAGTATGLRSTVGIAALIDAGDPGLPRPFRWRLARPAAWFGVAAELVLDKLPLAPSRLEPRGFLGRIVLAAASGAVLARGARRPLLPSVLVAVGTVFATARLGHDLRVAAAERYPPLAVALAEDAIALGLAAAASRFQEGDRDRRSSG
jgi:hypothetical protein